jgi:peptidoglycan/LPS O-acetylase OafA/YrhL
LQATFALSLGIAYFRARRARREWWARVNLWILSLWLAMMVNAAFDVYLEGPQGGIWFWCLIGFGIAALEAQRAERSESLQAARHDARGHAHRTPTPSMPQPALPTAGSQT